MGLIETLKQYDGSLSVAELIQEIELNRKKEEEAEHKEAKRVTKNYQNAYFKFIDNDGIFGKTLKVISFKDFVRKERTESWNFLYYFNGSILSFSAKELFLRDFRPNRADEGFTEKKLKSMTKISKKEFEMYNSKYEEITSELTKIIL